ncbi:MAG: tellurium resistance protein TerC [Planctomycetota bacterium]|nr:tellurium resistance protein TerC [Planctomycetota bacterium]
MGIFEFAFTLFMLVFLQAILGFDNLLYVSIESKRVEDQHQSYVRRMGIGLAIGFRILLLFLVIFLFKLVSKPLGRIDLSTTSVDGEGAEQIFQWLVAEFTVESVIVLIGGIFIIYTAFKEIFHMLSVEHLGEDEHKGKPKRSVGQAITWIVVMNIVFSFDSILSALALTTNLWVISLAILASGVMMIWLADGVSAFLQKNRMYEVLGLFILLVVGIMLVSEGAHKAHLLCFDHEIHAMEKSTFYFVIVIMVLIDVVQSRYQRKLKIEKEQVGAA